MVEVSDSLDRMGAFGPRYRAFLDTVASERVRLHRYCNRMVGGVLDGEDVVQEVLLEAFRKLELHDTDRPLLPWLLRIAYNRSIDHLRRHEVRERKETFAAEPDEAPEPVVTGREVGRAVERMVMLLPPKERACLLLKDVFDYSLEEIAPMVGSTLGGVKSALARARRKLAEAPAAATPRPPAAGALQRLYVERFNRRDWDGVRELIAQDCGLRITDVYAGEVADQYFGNFAALPFAWRLAPGHVEGEPVILVLRAEDGAWSTYAVVRLDVHGGLVTRIRQYSRCPWVFEAARPAAAPPGSPPS